MTARLVRFLSIASMLALMSGCSWITRASIDQDGNDSARGAMNTSLSASGQFVAFESSSDDLVPNDTNGEIDIFVRDVWNGTTVRASVDSDEMQYYVKSIDPAISADGRYVAFQKYNYPNGMNRIMVRDLAAGTTVEATLDPQGGPPNNDSNQPDISGDGRYVVFDTTASDLVGDFGTLPALVRYDMQTKTIVPVATVGGLAVMASGGSISDDGRYVAFVSTLSTDEGGIAQVYVHDMQTGVDTLASADPGGSPGNAVSDSPSISADGRYVAFASGATNLVPGDDGSADDIYVRDRATGTTERASVDSAGSNSNGRNQQPHLSGDGHYVAFSTWATDLIPDADTAETVVIRDLKTDTTMVGSSNLLGRPVRALVSILDEGNDLSGDGRYLSFYTSASITPNDRNGYVDVFVKMVVGAEVFSVTPTTIARGTTETFTIIGDRFPPGTTVQAGTQSQGLEQVVVEGVALVSDTELEATITVDANAPVEPLYIFVTVPGPGPGSWWPGTQTMAPVSPMIT